jgi:hypothetical protein
MLTGSHHIREDELPESKDGLDISDMSEDERYRFRASSESESPFSQPS